MLNDLIDKIALQTGIPPETVAPVVGAVFAHLGDILPAPLAHQLAIMLGVHKEGEVPDADGSNPQPTGEGLPGGLSGGLPSGGTGESFAGAASLMNVAQSLLGGFLSARR